MRWLGAVVLCVTLACGARRGGGGGDDDVPPVDAALSHAGLPQDTAIGALTVDEVHTLCEYIVGIRAMPEHPADCGQGLIITLGIDPEDVAAEVDRCAADVAAMPECLVTVTQFELCAEVNAALTDQDVCNRINDPNTMPFEECNVFDNPACQ